MSLGVLPLQDRRQSRAPLTPSNVCLAVDPGYGAARLFLGFAFAKEGRLDDSVAQFSRPHQKTCPIFRRPTWASARFSPCRANLSEALAELQTAQQLDPTNGEIQAQIAALQARQPADTTRAALARARLREPVPVRCCSHDF